MLIGSADPICLDPDLGSTDPAFLDPDLTDPVGSLDMILFQEGRLDHKKSRTGSRAAKVKAYFKL